MIYIILGACGFFLVQFFNVISLGKMPRAKMGIWALSNMVIVYSLIKICLYPDKLSLPVWTGWAGWVLFVPFFSLLIVSLFISLPFRETYVQRGVGGRLVTTGLYALTRHPGVPSLALSLFSLLLISRSRLLLVAAPLWSVIDVAMAIIEDRFFFRRMFPEYARYCQETPMLIPNRRSIRAFLSSLRRDTDQQDR